MELAIRLASFYGAVFLLVGIFLPFFPVWLKSRGLDEVEISFDPCRPLINPRDFYADDFVSRGSSGRSAPRAHWTYLGIISVTLLAFVPLTRILAAS